ncbi:MAG: hypothetical protein LPK07_15980 [Hymenobacteraceae bacterium]|nr:hypothetical protein [Hymenobacteraceae bacterium]
MVDIVERDHDRTQSFVTDVLGSFKYTEEQHRSHVGSGSMRGNDVTGDNGSYSQGTYVAPVRDADNWSTSYSDFINFNYGQERQRYYSHRRASESPGK